MRLDKSQISGTRFMFTIVFFLQSSVLLTSFITSITGVESWIPIITSVIPCMPLVYLFRTLMVMFPDKTFIEVLEEVYGPLVGKILGIGYAMFIITLTSLNLKDMGSIAKITVMQETPQMVLMLLCVIVAAFAARHGLKVVTRYSAVFTFIELAIVLLIVVLVINNMDFQKFLPFFQLPPAKYVQGTHIMMTIPVGELVVFLMLTPCVKLSKKSATKYWFIGVTIGMLTMLMTVLRDISILGNTISMFAVPGLVTMRLIKFGEAFSRIEILFSIGLTMLLFFKVAVLCYASTIAVAQLFKAKSYKNLTLIMGLFAAFYGMVLYPNNIVHTSSGQDVVPFMWTIFEFVLPILTLIIAKIRKKPAHPASEAEQEERQLIREGSS